MHRDDDDEALKELRDLPREIAPADGAEARTVSALRDRGLIVSGQRLRLRRAAVVLAADRADDRRVRCRMVPPAHRS